MPVSVPAGVKAIEATLGHRFAERALLTEALTHSSATGRGRSGRSNERLEFLGDRVLGLVIADLLIGRYPREGEGDLSRRHAALVRRETLAEVGRDLGVAQWLVVGRSEEDAGGRANPALLANVVEALIGALYLDAGLAAAERFILEHWSPRLETMAVPPRDAKTTLQEWAQSRGLGLPVYEVAAVAGPAHAPRFDVSVSLAGFAPGRAVAGSKRAAEQAAAEELLARVEAAHG
ncbi:MAG TPA: ribonuclease III [Geminicoccaceae bacterium]|nr:ribonuclease III [Geminicoccaceae bacterium]